jgi:hypothetical protein
MDQAFFFCEQSLINLTGLFFKEQEGLAPLLDFIKANERENLTGLSNGGNNQPQYI